VSSISVVNAIERKHPELVPVLFRDFYWHYFEPEMPSPVHFTRPTCREQGGRPPEHVLHPLVHPPGPGTSRRAADD
jgi:hypothetical protein